MTRALALRVGAIFATLLALVASSAYVAANAKNPGAPLRPPVARPTAAASAQPTGRIQIAPAVKATALPGITFTHVS